MIIFRGVNLCSSPRLPANWMKSVDSMILLLDTIHTHRGISVLCTWQFQHRINASSVFKALHLHTGCSMRSSSSHINIQQGRLYNLYISTYHLNFNPSSTFTLRRHQKWVKLHFQRLSSQSLPLFCSALCSLLVRSLLLLIRDTFRSNQGRASRTSTCPYIMSKNARMQPLVLSLATMDPSTVVVLLHSKTSSTDVHGTHPITPTVSTCRRRGIAMLEPTLLCLHLLINSTRRLPAKAPRPFIPYVRSRGNLSLSNRGHVNRTDIIWLTPWRSASVL